MRRKARAIRENRRVRQARRRSPGERSAQRRRGSSRRKRSGRSSGCSTGRAQAGRCLARRSEPARAPSRNCSIRRASGCDYIRRPGHARHIAGLAAYQWIGLFDRGDDQLVDRPSGPWSIISARELALARQRLETDQRLRGPQAQRRRLMSSPSESAFELLELLDLPIAVLSDVLPFKKFLLAGLIGWLGCRIIDLTRAVYSDSESMKPHRGLGDMIAPVTVRRPRRAWCCSWRRTSFTKSARAICSGDS